MAYAIAYFSLVILCSPFKVCAKSKEDLEGRIVGGDFAKIGSYPHAVFLEITRSDKTAQMCGSSIVNQHFLVTAAHCFSYAGGGMNDKIRAYAGHENLKRTNIFRKATSPIIHKKFDLEHALNDIALVYLPNHLPLGRYTKRIIITKSFPRIATGALAGWGIINEITNEETMLLKSVTQTIKNEAVCSRVISGPGTLCAGSIRSSDPRPAQGDSGSGLITDKYQLIGLLSFKETLHPALPVYTNVSYYYNWIRHYATTTYCGK